MKTLRILAVLLSAYFLSVSQSAMAFDKPWLPMDVEEGDENGDGVVEYRISTYFRGKTRLLSIVDTYWPHDGSARGRIQYLFYKGRLAYTEVTNYGMSNSPNNTLVHFFAESGAGISMDDKQGDGRVDAIGVNDSDGQLWAVFARESDGRLSPLDTMTEAKSETLSKLPVLIQNMLRDY